MQRNRHRPHASFGERVAVVDQLLGGALTREAACARHGIAEDELDEWLRMHARDRAVSLDEFRGPKTIGPGFHSLRSRLRQLETLLRARHRELLMLRQVARARGLL